MRNKLGRFAMDIALVASLIISCISSILLLNKYCISERIAMYILIQFILWFVNCIYVFLAMMLMHSLVKHVSNYYLQK